MRMLIRRLCFLLCLFVLLLVSNVQEVGAYRCHEIGWWWKSLSDEIEQSLGVSFTRENQDDLRGVDLVIRGFLIGDLGSFLCETEDAPEPAQIALTSTAKSQCVSLDHKGLWGDHPHLWNLTRQWEGEEVLVRGFLLRSDNPLGGNTHWSFDVRAIKTVDRGHSPAFCRDYQGPLEPAPRDTFYDDRWDLAEFSAYPKEGKYTIVVHPRKSVIGVFDTDPDKGVRPIETLDLPIPQPYSVRDVTVFEALTRDRYVIGLRGGSLYVWDAGAMREVETEGVVTAGIAGDGKVYYARSLPSKGVSGQLGAFVFRGIDKELNVKTVWESTDYEIIGWKSLPDDGGIELAVQRAPKRKEILLTFE